VGVCRQPVTWAPASSRLPHLVSRAKEDILVVTAVLRLVRGVISCAVSKLPMFHQWEEKNAGPWHAIVRGSGQDLVTARRDRFELEQTQRFPALAVLLSFRVISFHNLRKGAQSLSRHVSPHGFDHWVECSMAAPPFLARTKRLLSNRLNICRLGVDACHVLPAARSHLILHTLVMHDCSVMSHASLSELAPGLETR
jgi:hypothetical protein